MFVIFNLDMARSQSDRRPVIDSLPFQEGTFALSLKGWSGARDKGLCHKSRNSTNGSWWIVQVRPTSSAVDDEKIPPTAVGGLFKSYLLAPR